MSETPIQAKDDPHWWRTCGCEVCYEVGEQIHKPITGGFAVMANMRAWDKFTAHIKSCPYLTPRKQRVGNGTYQGAWAFTLTMSPKDGLSVGDMITAVRKLMRQKSCPVIRYAWHYEDKGRDVNGDPIHPHIHGMYETTTGGRIEAKHFKRAWSIWDEKKPMGAGFRGGYHRPVRSEERYDDYMSKDGGMGESWPVNDEQTE